MAWDLRLEVLRASDDHVYWTSYGGPGAKMTTAERRDIIEDLSDWDTLAIEAETVPALFEDGSYLVSTRFPEKTIQVTMVYQTANLVSRVNRLRHRILNRRRIKLRLTRSGEMAGNTKYAVEEVEGIVTSIDLFERLGWGGPNSAPAARVQFTVTVLGGIRVGEGDDE